VRPNVRWLFRDLGIGGGLAAAAFAVMPSLSVAWQAPAAPAFEAASVRFVRTGGGSSNPRIEPGRFMCSGMAPMHLIRMAYKLKPYQIVGGPAWLEEDRYSINAKANSPADLDQLRLMLRGLLTERFKLSFHRETKELAGYAIVVGRGGPILRNSSHGDPEHRHSVTLDSAADLVLYASLHCQCPIVDETKITAPMDIWVDLAAIMEDPNGMSPSERRDYQLNEMLRITRLKLEPRKQKVEVFVIDQAAKPDPGAN
jgi:uncharacterized protein (TIGR03435 family)